MRARSEAEACSYTGGITRQRAWSEAVFSAASALYSASWPVASSAAA